LINISKLFKAAYILK